MKYVHFSVLAGALCACGGGNTQQQEPTCSEEFCAHTPPSGSKNNAFFVTITGEGAATDGILFPPERTQGEPYFLDGWELKFTRVLVTLTDLTLSENPAMNPQDQSQTGKQISKLHGPWVVDLAKAGPLDSKEQNGKSWPLTRFEGDYDPTTPYAFGFSLAAAEANVFNVNLDDADKDAYRAMKTAGYAVLLEGDATFKGTDCRSTQTAYDFSTYPTPIHFSFGFAIPTDFVNCVNPELQPIDSRGVQSQSGAQTTTQVTFHLDHAFWEALEEDAPLRWDALAVRNKSNLTQDDLVGLDFQAFKDSANAAIPWRTCGPTLTNERTTGFVSYDPVGVAVNPAGGAAGLADLRDYMQHNLSTFGHLNNDGLCFPARKFPSPP
jgi:hypothetical protein